jgi:hypothetical protein
MNKKFNSKKTTFTKEKAELFKACHDDILEFVKYVHIFHPKFGWIPAGENLYEKQKEVLKELSENWDSRYHIVLSARQSGKSTLILLLVLWIITFSEGRVIAILAHKQKAAQGLFKRFSTMYHKLDGMFRLSDEIGDSKVELHLADGTQVFCGTTTPTGLRSESLSLLITDEFAFVPAVVASEFYYSNMPTLEQMKGGYIAISTPNGKDNIFYDLYRKGKDAKDKMWKLLEINWKDVFNRDTKWKNEKIKELSIQGKSGQAAFDREYGNSFDVLSEGIKFFDQEVISAMQPEFILDRYVHKPNDDSDAKYYIDIFNDLVSSNTFVAGVDLAEGKGNHFSTLHGFECFVSKHEVGETYKFDHAFGFMHSGIKVDEFFDLTFKFLINELNDKWFLIFENNDIGRNWDIRFRYLIDEIAEGHLSYKNSCFSEILNGKFEGDSQLLIEYLTTRVFRKLLKGGSFEYGFKADKNNVPLLKTTMKRLVDYKEITFKSGPLITEAKQYEDVGGKGTKKLIVFENIPGKSHYDNLSGIRTALYPLTEASLLKTVLGIRPLSKQNGLRMNAQMARLNAVAGFRQASRNTQIFEAQQMARDIEDEFGIEGTVPLSVEIPDSTSGWKRYRGHFGIK